MQKWEYLFVEAEFSEQRPQYHLVPRFENYEEIPNWKIGKSLVAYINELGEQGWEIVCVNREGLEFIFKRPIDNSG